MSSAGFFMLTSGPVVSLCTFITDGFAWFPALSCTSISYVKIPSSYVSGLKMKAFTLFPSCVTVTFFASCSLSFAVTL